MYVCRRRHWHPTPVLLPGKSHGRRSLVGCSPWDRWELDTTQWLHFHFSLSCIGEDNGNPLQCSCLENPRDGAAWWAAVYGVAQSRTQLKRLSRLSSRETSKLSSIMTTYPWVLWVWCCVKQGFNHEISRGEDTRTLCSKMWKLGQFEERGGRRQSVLRQERSQHSLATVEHLPDGM